MNKQKTYQTYLAKIFKGRDLAADAGVIGITQSDLEAMISGSQEITMDQAIQIGKLTATNAVTLLSMQTESQLEGAGYVAPKVAATATKRESKRDNATGGVSSPERGKSPAMAKPGPRRIEMSTTRRS
jgi:plasmid maintenance system antidote protein VapI